MKASTKALCFSFFITSLSAYVLTTAHAAEALPPKAHEKIDLNHADESALTGSFKGIGKKRAEAIIAYREAHHGFKSLDELAEIKGIGQHFVQVNHKDLEEVFQVK